MQTPVGLPLCGGAMRVLPGGGSTLHKKNVLSLPPAGLPSTSTLLPRPLLLGRGLLVLLLVVTRRAARAAAATPLATTVTRPRLAPLACRKIAHQAVNKTENMQSVLINECFPCKVSVLMSAFYAKCSY